MNRSKRQLSRKAKHTERVKFQHDAKMGTSDREAKVGREYGCGPGFPKDVSKDGNAGRRRNPLPGPGQKLVTA